jgi:hypothetical protein
MGTVAYSVLSTLKMACAMNEVTDGPTTNPQKAALLVSKKLHGHSTGSSLLLRFTLLLEHQANIAEV